MGGFGEFTGSFSKTKSSGATNQRSEQQAFATEEEKQMNALDLELRQRAQGGMLANQDLSLNLLKNMLSGQALPGVYGQLSTGFSEDVINQMVQKSIRDLMPQFQQLGALDSGAARSLAARTGAETRLNATQYNMTNALNMLNTALGGIGSVESPILSSGANLGSRLAGLRQQTGSSQSHTYGKTSTQLYSGNIGYKSAI